MSFRSDIGWDKYLKPFLYKRLPDRTGWSAVLGTLCALTFIVLVMTGMILAFYYVPSPDKAWDSVRYISNDVPLGKILRGLHHWGAGLMVFLVFCHLMVTYVHGSYAKPRQLTWITGVCLFLVTLGLGFTGYLLPWDMKAYWATVVGANIPNQYPGVGNYITRFILGGNDISGFTLSRFYSVHTLILPACLLLIMAMHIYLIRTSGWPARLCRPPTASPTASILSTSTAPPWLSDSFSRAWCCWPTMRRRIWKPGRAPLSPIICPGPNGTICGSSSC